LSEIAVGERRGRAFSQAFDPSRSVANQSELRFSTADDDLDEQFELGEIFAMIHVDAEKDPIILTTGAEAPEHQPGRLSPRHKEHTVILGVAGCIFTPARSPNVELSIQVIARSRLPGSSLMHSCRIVRRFNWSQWPSTSGAGTEPVVRKGA